MSERNRELFPPYAEARAIVQALGIRSRSDYKARYREDLRLPSNPNKIYADMGWKNWADFLGKAKPPLYAYAEAQAVVQVLGIKDSKEYRVRCREDPRLPFSPEKTYARVGWTDWFDFLGKKKPSFYASYNEAQAAVQALGIKGVYEYFERYREDPKLPSNPDHFYKKAGWTDWFTFLGKERSPFYATYAEAQMAVQALGITSRFEYRARYREDSQLPGHPQNTYGRVGWTNWAAFLGRAKPSSFYTNYTEAQAAAQMLGIKSQAEYKRRYREDSKLPASPERVYAGKGWSDWFIFLGKVKPTFYVRYAEAQAAVQALGIKSLKEYRTRHQEDLRLPAAPEQFYAGKGWTNSHDFLNKKRPCFYATYAEAKASVLALGIETREEYSKHHREDPKLPAAPAHTYANSGWIGWADFLGNEKRHLYSTYDEAKIATQALGIKLSSEYKVRYREDPRLPAVPEKVYAGAGWTNWYDFLGSDKPIDVSPEYPNVWVHVEKWLENETSLPQKLASMKALLSGYFKPLSLPDDPRYLLLRANPFNAEAYQQFIETQVESRRKVLHRAVTAFFRWVLNEYCTDVDADERIVLPGCRNPFETVLAGWADSLQYPRPSQSTKPPLGYEYILRARDFLVPNGEQVLVTRPSLKDLPHLQDFFDSPRTDWVDIEKSRIDQTDPNCIWRLTEGVLRVIDGKRQKVDVYQVWSPVRFVALYSLLRYPLRGQQFLWLDSGETDDEIAVLDVETGSVRWEMNTGPLAGKGPKKRRRQAAIQRGHNDLPKLYVTTNKTGRTDGGYEVEWVPDDLVYWFILLRDWQSKYNPLEVPTSWLEVSMPSLTNRKILKARGTQSFLFRTDASGQPLTTASAFLELLPALLYRIQREGEKLAEANLGLGPRFTSPYTPHSLRVSLITAFIIDGDAPIHLISKLVGHASLVMTIYYIKMGGEQMRRAMGETEKRAAQLAAARHAQTIRAHGLHPLRSQLIATDGNRSLLESDVPNSACVVFDCGICPMSAALCHIGGDLLAERKSEGLYGPVEAGYLGQKNCPRCRFFITGIPFLGGLVALLNELSLEIYTEGGRYQGYASEVDRLEQEHYDTCQANRPDTQESQRKSAITNLQQSGGKLDGLLKDFVAVNHYVQGCLKLIKQSDQEAEDRDGIRLIAAGDLRDIGVTFEESNTQYHLLAEICQNATIYQSANPSRALPLISQAIDRMAENNSLKPAMFRLADEEKLIVANELNRLLLERLGSWERIDDLFSGDLMLLDIDAHEPQLKRISTEIQNLLLHGATRQITDEITTP